MTSRHKLLALAIFLTSFATNATGLFAAAQVAHGPASPASHETGADSCTADDIWYIDTRGSYASCCAEGTPHLRVERFLGTCHWAPAEQSEVTSPSARPQGTIVYIHGNRVSSATAKREGLRVYQGLKRHAAAEDGFRFVIFAWPADQIHGQLQDVRVKAARTGAASWHLAHFLERMPGDEPVGLMGYSFGARIVTGSLQLLASGQLGCYVLEHNGPGRSTGVRTVLIASALHSHWLNAGQFHGLAVTQMDRLLLLNNSCDFALKRYHAIERCSNPAALGYVGLSESRLVDHAAAVEQWNARSVVGRDHSLAPYLCSDCLMSKVWDTLRLDSQIAESHPVASTDE
ncbi:MAG: hypothetical protein KDA42_12445 [Planctomycetales bacterium]|nr:hypothetical protein [Planctomycetales bacterium]